MIEKEKTEKAEVEIVDPVETVEAELVSEAENMEWQLNKKFNLDEETYLEYANMVSKKRSIKTTLITALIIAVVVYFFFKTDNWLDSLKYMAIYAGAYILIAFVSNRVLTPRMMKNTYHKKNIGLIEFDLTVKESGISQHFEEGTQEIAWGEFVDAQESERLLFLVMANKRALLLPKNIFDAEELVKVRDILNNNLSEFANHLRKEEAPIDHE